MLGMVSMVFSRVTFDEMDPFGARVYKRCSGRFQLVVHDAWESEGKRLSDDAGRCQAVQGVLKGATLRIGHGEFLVDAHPTMTIRGTRQMAVKPHSPAAAGDDPTMRIGGESYWTEQDFDISKALPAGPDSGMHESCTSGSNRRLLVVVVLGVALGCGAGSVVSCRHGKKDRPARMGQLTIRMDSRCAAVAVMSGCAG